MDMSADEQTAPARDGCATRGSTDQHQDVAMEQAPSQPAAEDVEDEEEGGVRIGDIYLPPPPPPACTFESDGPRLIITHIVNENFKSYLGRQVLGPFHKSFTSIIGPNGSGKSNVIDSMLFVFGYRAQKIRSKKLSVLIHKSDNHRDINCCSVAVHFQKIIDQGSDDYTVVAGSELVVARTAFADNSSYYTVNGTRRQFRQVARLLRTEGIDLDHNRFLILQGEVEQISLMKPKAQTEHECGMLEYLEDIVGSSRYKEPIELLSGRVDELNELRAEKLNRVKLVEKEKQQLEAPKNEALGYIRLQNQLNLLHNSRLQRKIYDCGKESEAATGQRDKLEESMAGVRQQLHEAEQRRTAQQTQLDKCHAELVSVGKSKEKTDELFKQQGEQDVKINEDLKQAKEKSKKIKKTLKSEQEKLSELEAVPERNTAEIASVTERRDQLKLEREQVEQQYQQVMSGLREETRQFQDDKDRLEAELATLTQAVDSSKSKMDGVQCELDLYVGGEQSERARLVQLESNLQTARDHVTEQQRLPAQLDSCQQNQQQQLEAARQQLAAVDGQLPAVEQQLRSGRCKLEEGRSALAASRGRGVVLASIMQQKSSGALPGVFGRLGDLGSIDEKYDVAVSTACGPLDNIVVDSVDTAQQCIGYLKHNNLGTATFIALDKMNKWRAHTTQRINTPENVPRLFDLVTVHDERVSTAFYFALRDTLVADSLAQATRIGYGRQRHRVVTLKGDLIEPSGTMSGGGKKSLCGRMTTGGARGGRGSRADVVNISAADVEQTEADVARLTDECRQLKLRRHQLLEQVAAAEKQLGKLAADRRKATLQLQSAEQKVSLLETQVQEQTLKLQQATPDKRHVKQLQKQLDAATAEYEKAESVASVVQSKVSEVNEKIRQVTGGKLQTAQKKLDSVVKAFDKARADIARLGQAIKTADRNAVKCRDKISSLQADAEEAVKEREALIAARDKLEAEASDVIAKTKELQSTYSRLEGELGELKQKMAAILSDEDKAKTAKIELDQRVEKFVAKIKECADLVSKYKRELGRLEIQSVPEADRQPDDVTQLPQLDEQQLAAVELERVVFTISSVQDQLGKLKPDLAALAEYRKKEAVFISRVAELDEITARRDTQRSYYDQLRKQRLNEFMTGFAIITSKLKEMYQMITLGGDAELELVDSLDPFSEGIVFSVRPPKKSWKNITNLSGGEKTLSSLALVFALHYYKPTPLYVMDEIDAALDFKNVSIVGNYVKDRTKNAQFIIISLRSQMFELADRLVGIYKTHDATKSVTINPALIAAPPLSPPPPHQSSQQSTLRQTTQVIN